LIKKEKRKKNHFLTSSCASRFKNITSFLIFIIFLKKLKSFDYSLQRIIRQGGFQKKKKSCQGYKLKHNIGSLFYSNMRSFFLATRLPKPIFEKSPFLYIILVHSN